MTPYQPVEFTPSEAELLRPYFTNLTGPVFAVVNLPELVRAALFARAAQTSLGVRQLFVKEFAGELDTSVDQHLDASETLDEGPQRYSRVFLDHGDDSVAQLGGVHLVCEQATALMARAIWASPNLTSVQSFGGDDVETRVSGRHRYFRDPAILGSSVGTKYIAGMDRIFGAYQDLVPAMIEFEKSEHPRLAASDFVHHQAVRRAAVRSVRGVLPNGALCSIGIFASAQAFEQLLLRLRAEPLPEARDYAMLMLSELRRVLPAFFERVDDEDRGGAWSHYLGETRQATTQIARRLLPKVDLRGERSGDVELRTFDPSAEARVVAAMLQPVSTLPHSALTDAVAEMGIDDRLAVMRSYVGDRRNRRHLPGVALTAANYRFDVVADCSTFADLQRFPGIEAVAQRPAPGLGFDMPDSIHRADMDEVFEDAVILSEELYDLVVEEFPQQAPYTLSQANRLRFSLALDARDAIAFLESATEAHQPCGVVRIAREVHRQIAEVAGHQAIAAMMRFVDHHGNQARFGSSAAPSPVGHPASG